MPLCKCLRKCKVHRASAWVWGCAWACGWCKVLWCSAGVWGAKWVQQALTSCEVSFELLEEEGRCNVYASACA